MTLARMSGWMGNFRMFLLPVELFKILKHFRYVANVEKEVELKKLFLNGKYKTICMILATSAVEVYAFY